MSDENDEILTYYEMRVFRDTLHPLLRFTRKSGDLGVDVYKAKEEELSVSHPYRGGYQRKDLTKEQLTSLSKWLDNVEEDSVANNLGFRFKYEEDAIYYKLKWATSESQLSDKYKT